MPRGDGDRDGRGIALQLCGTRRALARLLGAAAAATAAALALVPTGFAATFTVNTTDDASDGVCDAVHCSLREAITAANTSADAVDGIVFAIGAGGVQTISPTAALPALTGPTVLDGTTQVGWAVGAPVIVLDGSAVTGTGVAHGLRLNGGSSTVRGLVIQNFSASAIDIGSLGGNVVEGNFLGTDVSGTLARPNVNGVSAFSGNNTIGGTTPEARNVIAGNAQAGLHLTGVGSNLVQGNHIGTTADGAARLANGARGIELFSPGNTVGGTAAGARNVISGNQVQIAIAFDQADGNVVQGNYIGPNAAGTASIGGGGGSGVEISSSADGNLLGGAAPEARNVISGNAGRGVFLWGAGTSGNDVRGNYIGVDASGAGRLGNGVYGVLIQGTDSNTVRENVISDNASGVVIGGSGVTTAGQEISSNAIGWAAGHTAVLGQRGAGVVISNSSGTRILANAIAGHTDVGVLVDPFGGAAVGNQIRSTTFRDNSGPGIDLVPRGVTANDAGDADTGANELQNFPVLTSVTVGASGTTIQGTLESTPNASFELDFFSSGACDPSGFGEGAAFLGTATARTDGSGAAAFSHTVATALGPAAQVTATATDAAGNTSEFSACAGVAGSGGPVLSVTKTDSADPVSVGELFTYTIVVANTGTATATNATLSDSLPALVVYRSHTTSAGTCSNVEGFSCSLGDLGAGTSVSVTVTVEALAEGTASNVAAASSSETEATSMPETTTIGPPAGLVVNSTADPGDGTCNASECTLREAIARATANEGRETIAFAIAGPAPHTISVTSPLPVVSDLVIDATTQPGYLAQPLIRLDNAATVFAGIESTGGATIRGLSVTRFVEGLVLRGGGNVVESSWIGVDPVGLPAGNTNMGIRLHGPGNRVGGPEPAQRNVVSSNGNHGIILGLPESTAADTENEIVGNVVGLAPNGVDRRANASSGILVWGTGNEIRSNTVSGNGTWGIFVGGHGNLLAANVVGPATTGAALSASNPVGIRFQGMARDNRLGSGTPEDANLVAFNASEGIEVGGDPAVGNSFLVNRVHSNGGLGIDLDADGVTPNDPGDADAGPNQLQNFPVVSSARWTGAATRIQATLASAAGTAYRIDWYASPACDPSGHGEGARWIGWSLASTDATGLVRIDTGEGLTAADTSGEFVSAIATDPAGNSSEFAPCVQVEGAGAALTLLTTPASCVPDDFDGVVVTFDEPLETPVAERYAPLGLHILDDGLREPQVADPGAGTRSPPNALVNTTGDGDPALVLTFDEPQTAIGMFVGLGPLIEWSGTAPATLRAFNGETLLGSVETAVGTTSVTSFVGVRRSAGGMTRLELHIPGFDERIDDLCFVRTAPPPSGDVSNLKVTASDAGLHVGVASVAVASIPASHIPFLGGAPASGLGSLPVSDIPVSDIPVSDIPVSDIPVSDIPVSDIGLGAAGTAALRKILLSSIPAPWPTILEGTPLAGRPLQTLTLADVFADTTARGRFGALDVGEAGLTTSLLRGTRLTSLLLGGATLSRIPVPGGYSSWCAALQAAGGSCAGLDPATDTVLGLDIQAAPVSDIPVSDIPVSDIPVSDIPVSDIPVSDIDLAATRLGDVLLRAIPDVDTVVDCARISCTGTNTLEDAAALNPSAIRPAATLLALRAVFGNVTLGELLLAMIRKVDFPWHRMALAGMQTFAGTGESSRYEVSFDLACAAGSPTVTLTPPPGFVPRPGSSRLTVGTAATVAIADPVRTTTGRLRWPGLTLQACSTGVTHRPVALSVDALAGFSLGERPAAASVSVSEASASAPNQAPVVVAQNWEPGDDAASAPVIQPGTLVVGHIASGDDVDYFRVPIPSTRGTRTKVYLGGMVDADFDLVLMTPTAPSLLSNPVSDISLDTVPMTDPGLALNRTRDALPPETLQDIPVSDIPVSDIPVSDISANRGVEEEAAQAIALGESGYYTIAVKGYNGARSDHPYKLYVKRVAPPTLPPCPARSFPNASPNAAALPASLPGGTQTLFLVARDRLSRLYGETAVQGLLGKVATLAARPEVGGAILPVDGDAAVRSAFAAWDASPCSIDAANAVVRNVNAVVDRYRPSLPSLRYLVILGGHEAFPMALVPDLVTLSNEQDYARSLAFTTQGLTKGNALHAAALLGYVLTDDAYTAQGAIRWLNRELYLPRISGSRLVETPAEMGRQIDRYLASNGTLATGTTSTLTTGYDFLTDGSLEVAAPLDTVFSATSRLISDVWDGAALSTALAGKTLSSVNAHYSHFQVQPAKYAGPADLLTSTQLLPAPADTALPGFASHVAFTMGCHAGLNVPDTLGGDATRLRDFAQAYAQNEAAVYIANTAFGYGDTAGVGLSEKLVALLAEEVPGATTFGEKLVRAKQAYFRQMGTYGVFDEKALVALTLYGLPFYRFAGGTAPPAPQPPALVPGPLPGTQIGTVDVTPPLQRHDGARGSFWSSSDGTQFAHYRVPQPLVTRDVTVPGTLLHGVEIKTLSTEDVGGVNPFFATPTVDLAAHEPEPNVADAIYPANFVNVATSHELGQTRQSLVLVAGQYRPTTPAGPTGVQRLVRRLAGDLWYSTSTDTAAPVFSQVGAVRGGGTTTLFAHVADGSGSVHKVSALYTVGGAWTYVTLAHQGGELWTASLPFDAEVHVLFQAGDAAGNWGYTTAKGYLFTALPPDDGAGPHVEIESPLPGSYVLGSSVPARYSCSDPAGVSRCDGTVANGAGVDTSSVGEHVFAVAAADLGGGTTTATRRYSVRYAFSGFGAPVRTGLNSARAGQTIPVKWQLRDAAGGYVRDLASVVAIGSRRVDCANRPAETLPDADDGDATGVKYDATNEQFVYTWKTQGSWAGTCRRLVVTLNDGTLHTADFSFR